MLVLLNRKRLRIRRIAASIPSLMRRETNTGLGTNTRYCEVLSGVVSKFGVTVIRLELDVLADARLGSWSIPVPVWIYTSYPFRSLSVAWTRYSVSAIVPEAPAVAVPSRASKPLFLAASTIMLALVASSGTTYSFRLFAFFFSAFFFNGDFCFFDYYFLNSLFFDVLCGLLPVDSFFYHKLSLL